MNPQRLPTVPGCITGIVGEHPGQGANGRTVFEVQCSRCLDIEEGDILPLISIHFHTRSPMEQNPRLCRPCRVELYADCACYACDGDRKVEKR